MEGQIPSEFDGFCRFIKNFESSYHKNKSLQQACDEPIFVSGLFSRDTINSSNRSRITKSDQQKHHKQKIKKFMAFRIKLQLSYFYLIYLSFFFFFFFFFFGGVGWGWGWGVHFYHLDRDQEVFPEIGPSCNCLQCLYLYYVFIIFILFNTSTI